MSQPAIRHRILAGALWGAASVIRGQGEVWFDTVTALVFLLLVGRFVELRQQNRARQAVVRENGHKS